MNPRLNKQVAEVFRLCRKHISTSLTDSKTAFICHAIIVVYRRTDSYELQVACGVAQRIIDERLRHPNGTERTVSDWLCDNGYLSRDERELNYNVVQAYRLRWVDALVEEFSQ